MRLQIAAVTIRTAGACHTNSRQDIWSSRITGESNVTRHEQFTINILSQTPSCIWPVNPAIMHSTTMLSIIYFGWSVCVVMCMNNCVCGNRETEYMYSVWRAWVKVGMVRYTVLEKGEASCQNPHSNPSVLCFDVSLLVGNVWSLQLSAGWMSASIHCLQVTGRHSLTVQPCPHPCRMGNYGCQYCILPACIFSVRLAIITGQCNY